MSFLALNLQAAEASVAMHEMLIATAAKEIGIRQTMAFPFLGDACNRRTRPSCRDLDEGLRQRGNDSTKSCGRFGAPTVVLRGNRRLHALTAKRAAAG